MCHAVNMTEVHVGDFVQFVCSKYGHDEPEHLGKRGTVREICGPFVVVDFEDGSWTVCFPEELQIITVDNVGPSDLSLGSGAIGVLCPDLDLAG